MLPSIRSEIGFGLDVLGNILGVGVERGEIYLVIVLRIDFVGSWCVRDECGSCVAHPHEVVMATWKYRAFVDINKRVRVDLDRAQ